MCTRDEKYHRVWQYSIYRDGHYSYVCSLETGNMSYYTDAIFNATHTSHTPFL